MWHTCGEPNEINLTTAHRLFTGPLQALLIISSMHYRVGMGAGKRKSDDFAKRNMAMVCALLACSYVGNVYGMAGMANTASTFWVLWLVEKYVTCLDRKGGSLMFRAGYNLAFVGLATRAEGPHLGLTHRTCGEATEIESAATCGLLNASQLPTPNPQP